MSSCPWSFTEAQTSGRIERSLAERKWGKEGVDRDMDMGRNMDMTKGLKGWHDIRRERQNHVQALLE